MSAAEPFPPLLRWALLGPFAVFAACYFLALANRDSSFTKGALIFATGAAGLVELLAVPVAVFLLVRNPRYISTANILMTLAAAIPVALVALVFFVLSFGHFHI